MVETTGKNGKFDPVSYRPKIKAEHLAAGFLGGVVSTFVLHPLDLVKIRFQVNEGFNVAASRPQYHGIWHAIKSIKKSHGFGGLYQGVTPNVSGAGLSWGFYFLFYSQIKDYLQDGDSKKNLGPAKNIAAAAASGFATLVLANPIWVTKTRLCLQYENSGSSVVRYNGMIDALLKIGKTEGYRGLYKGFVPGCLGISHGAIQFMVYEEMKTQYNLYRKQDLDHRLTTVEYLSFAAGSKMIAAVLTYPYQVLRSRLQDQHRSHTNLRSVVKSIWKYEGFKGFYKGMGIYLWHVTPNICIVFLLYEYITNWKPLPIGWYGYYKGLTPNLLRVVPACALTFVVYENTITYFNGSSVK
ncbi:hypothetical protein LOTGIDRAFT_197574 [Lottia gigantea]|uniref:Solute carrier family 25 member 32 n=1 Tax=Lottia gigantea TaxID=225164 RepID=V3ZQQ4_LOTGI|nr:hypothetical protein LOTGIDRAFT_197574 [Lottia gigantea]ESO83221.1 hypothetical protein LOTGIDRAFT_197574 [Lottia gigantea]